MYKCGINEIYANYMSWILYNYVSFVTNRKSVLALFYLSRVSTLLIETGIIFALVTGLKWNAMGVKVFTSILVIFLNYFISKKFIFSIQYEKKDDGEMLSEDEVCREIAR